MTSLEFDGDEGHEIILVCVRTDCTVGGIYYILKRQTRLGRAVEQFSVRLSLRKVKAGHNMVIILILSALT